MSRYGGPTRDRSPPRFSDRRPSTSHSIPPAHLSFRGGAEAGHTSSREIPRGPKADTLRHAGPPTPRGRGGFGPRPDFRDRDVAPSFRRETDRSDWPRRDRDFPVGDREPFSSRDPRPLQSRDRSMSPNRVRREIKEAPPTAPRMPEPLPMWHGSGGRGGSLRARGRPDWDRGRGRPFLTERDGFGPRSRSRESWRDRDRDWERHDVDNRERFDRRDNERSLERDDRDREAAGWRHDPSPSRNSSGNQAAGPSRLNAGAPSHTPHPEPARRFSTTLTPAATPREARRDTEKGDYFSTSVDLSVEDIKTRRAISPPSAPTVPAFGSSLEYVKPSKTQSAESLAVSPFDKPPTVSQTCKPVESLPGNAQDTPFQPPKGPKADRGVVAGALPYKEPKSFGSEIRAKQEIQPRPVRPFMNSTSTNSAGPGVGPSRNENWESFTGSGSDTKTLPDKQLTLKPGTSSTSSALSLKRSDPHSGKTLPPKTPPIIPTGPAAMESSPTSQRSNIPTGPRIQPKQYSHPWSAPGYKVPTGPTRPSIMNSAPSKPPQAAQRERNYGLPASHRNNADPFVGQNIKPRVINKSPETDRSPNLHRRESFTHTSPEKVTTGKEMETSTKEDALLEISLARSSDEEVDDEDDGLDEEGFANSERKFKKEMDILAGKRPLSPLSDLTIVGLLVRIQLLAMIADGSAPSGIEADLVMEEIETEKPTRPLGLPSPAAEEQREESPEPAGRRLKDAQCNPIPTPPIEDLPFLSATIRDEQFFFGSSDDDDEVHETILSSLCKELSSRAREAELNHMQLREAFSNMYAPWRNAVSNMDRMKREENPLTPAPASPPVSIAPTVVPTPLIERTRGAKNITELDLQNILKASEQSAREEQERRDRELTSKPNYDMEAVIPIMMEQHEMESSFFEDRNQLVGEQNALDVFAFVPPQDDFTPEEQKAFIAAFNSHPKRWSEIADCLPGRDFQQCILHYYLTKHTAKYKDLWRKTLPKKKRGRGPAVRPRSTALMSDLVYEREEVDGTPAGVTDRGRPRRAAAPTFGEAATELENAIIPATTSRRLAKESNGEQPVEKPTSRKRAGPKVPRKTKAAIGPATGPSPQKVEKEIKAARANGKLDVFVPKYDEGFIPDVQTGMSVDTEQSRPPPTLPKTSTLDGTASGRPLTTARNGSQQSSSYWSVPETTYFPTLVDFFGRDWAGISRFMETKTSNMVKNHFAREVLNGKQWLEDRAQAAEERKSRGEPPGFQLDPIPPPKRKYDTTPSSQRLLVSNLESAEPKTEAPSAIAKPPTVEDFSPPLALRGLTSNDQVPVSRFTHTSQPRPLSALVSHPPVEETLEVLPTTNAPVSRPSHGPRAGFFSEDRRDVRQAHTLAQQQPPQSSAPSLQGDTSHVSLSQRNPQLLAQQPSTNTAQSMQQIHRQYTNISSPAGQPSHHQQRAPPQQSNSSHLSNMRNGSSVIPASPLQVILKQEPEVSYLRHEHQGQRIPYGQSPAQSPIDSRFPSLFTLSNEPARPSSTPLQANVEPPKAAPAKRSNIMSILNDEPSEPPTRKRPIADGDSRMSSFQSPTITNFDGHLQSKQQIPPQRQDFPSFLQNQQARSPLLQHSNSIHNQPTTNPPSNNLHRLDPPASQTSGPSLLGATPSTQLGREWMQRFDPRQSSSSNGPDQDLRTQQPSTMSPYATAASSSASQTRGEQQQQQQQQPPSSVSSYQYRMAMQQQPFPLPSPPAAPSMPVQQPFHRTSSSQSNHTRIPSYSHSQQATQIQSAPGPTPPQPSSAPPPNITRPPSVGFDVGSMAMDQQQQHHSHPGYNYTLRQQQQQQPQHQPPSWMEDYPSMFRQMQQRHPPRYEPQQQMVQQQQQDHMLLQQQQQHQSRGSTAHQYSTAPPSRTYTPSGGVVALGSTYSTHPTQQHQQQQQQQGHMRHYSQSGGGGMDERR